MPKNVSAAKNKRRPKKNQNQRSSGQKVLLNRLPELLVVCGLLFVLISGLHWYWRSQALTLSQEIVADFSTTESDAALPVSISIPNLIDVGIELGGYDDGQWALSATQASYLTQSARPGRGGNIVVYGHNQASILGNLRRIQLGDEILVKTDDGLQHRYRVNRLVEVNPDQVEYIEPTNYEVLTLYTCSGFMDRRRLIVQAIPALLAEVSVE
jgi:LPXTG-site transpeptidase (sortase) family protein